MTTREPLFFVRMDAAAKEATLEIYDEIGPWWAGMIDAQLVSSALKNAGPLDRVKVRINSPGGSAFEGVAIHNLLRDHPAHVTTIVDGVAASAASLIFMAGDERRVPSNALVMIHNPSTVARGERGDLLKAATMLDQVKQSAIETYAGRTGLPTDRLAKMMDDETWLTGKEAVELKFATAAEADVSMVADPVESTRYRDWYRNIPRSFSGLIALSAKSKEPPVSQPSTKPNPAPEAPAAGAPAPTNAAPAADPKPPAAPAGAQPAAAAPPAAPVAPAADPVQLAIAAERKRVADIHAACKLAGCTELAQKYVDDGTTIGDVQTALFSKVCAERTAVGGAPAAQPENQQPSVDDKFRAEFKAEPAYAKSMTEDEYVAMRRVDVGLDPLAAKPADKPAAK